jgi:hypothetical protein
MDIESARKKYHREICKKIVRLKKDKTKAVEYLNFADSGNRNSIIIAQGIIELTGFAIGQGTITGQRAGDFFEVITKAFIQDIFQQLQHLRPGNWLYSTEQTAISGFDQYAHLAHLAEIIKKDKTLSPAIGGDYIIAPDIIVSRLPVSDDDINAQTHILDKNRLFATATPLRKSNYQVSYPILHASISCKWTIRSDRAQNTRTEALNLIRNRKGPLPHVVAVTAEPLPTRIAALALGTGDLDCVYHFALPELKKTIEKIDNKDQLDMLNTMIEGRRLRDISDLPFDLAI